MALLVWLITATPTAWAQQYHFDKVHTQVLFFVDHLGFSKSQGEFLRFDGGFDFSESNFAASSVHVVIYTDSLDMDNERWNQRMKSHEYFDVAKFPTMEFRSTRVVPTGAKTFDIHGDLTMLGVTQPMVINTRFNKAGAQLRTGDQIAGFSATASLLRSKWGMKRGIPFVGDEVEIRIEVEGIFER